MTTEQEIRDLHRRVARLESFHEPPLSPLDPIERYWGKWQLAKNLRGYGAWREKYFKRGGYRDSNSYNAAVVRKALADPSRYATAERSSLRLIYYDRVRIMQEVAELIESGVTGEEPYYGQTAGDYRIYRNEAFRWYRDHFIDQFYPRPEYKQGSEAMPPIRAFPQGLMQLWFRYGDQEAKQMVLDFAQKCAWVRPENAIQPPEKDLWREQGYCLEICICSNILDPGSAPRMKEFLESAIAHSEYNISEVPPAYKAFQGGIVMNALLLYWRWIEQDPRIPPLVKRFADRAWGYDWLPNRWDYQVGDWDKYTGERFVYQHPGPGEAYKDNIYSVDNNMLIAPSYAFTWQTTGDRSYRDKAETIFAAQALHGGTSAPDAYARQQQQQKIFQQWMGAE